MWKIVPQGNSTYKIKVIDEDKLYGVEANSALYANSYIAVSEGKTTVDPLVDKSTAGYENAGDEWKFVTPAVYEAFHAKKQLQEQLNKADEIGFTDYGEYAGIYNNPAATVEEVEAAAASLKQAIVDWQSSSATPETPVDFTNVIANNSFTDGTTNGWTTVNSPSIQASATYETITNEYKMQSFAEKWTGWGSSLADTELSQVLENMPVGNYRLTANTIGYQQNDNKIRPYGVYLYAENSGIESRAEAHSLEFGGLKDGVVSEADPQPRNTVLEFLAMDGTIKIGFKVANTNCNWVAVDNFKLEYLGKGEGGVAGILENVLTQAEELKNGYDLQKKKYSAAGEAKYNELLETVKQAASNPDIDEEAVGVMVKSLQAGMDTLKADVEAYDALTAKTVELSEAWDESAYADQAFPEYEEYLSGLEDAYENRTFNPLELDSIQPRADRLWISCVKNALINGETNNVTGIMVNPGWDANADGWTKTGDGSYNQNNSLSEVWSGKDWEVYQEITNLPQGSYRITMQGYYSPSSTNNNSWHEGWGQEGDKTNDILAYLSVTMLPNRFSM